MDDVANTTSKQRAADGEYTAAGALTVLEGLDGVRKRVAMYLGSTDSRAVTHCVYEILDNAVDEALAKMSLPRPKPSRIIVTAHADGSISVVDDGRGIPVDVEPRSGLPGVRLVFERLHAGGKFGGAGYKVAGGLHGVGASVVNAVSSRVDVEVRRDGGRWHMSFRRGDAGFFSGEGPDASFTAAKTPKRVGRSTAAERGTSVRFWPDPTVFQPGSSVDWESVRQRAYTTAGLVDGLTIELRDERGDEASVEEVAVPGGTAEMLAARVGDAPIVGQVWRCSGVGTYSEQAQVLGEDGKLRAAEVQREVEVDVALAWADRFDRDVNGYVNVVATPAGGTHVAGFERAVVRVVQQAVAGTNLLKGNEEAPTKDDVMEGLVAVVAVRVPEPEFEGQTKEALGTAAVAKVVADIVGRDLATAFGAARLRPAGRSVCEKVVAAGRARRAARERRDAVRKGRNLTSGPLPAKLRDCRVHDGSSELFIVEGDSAGGSVGAGRDSRFQAYLPIRGKILNTVRATPKALMENAEVSAIIAALGVTPPPRSHLLHDVADVEREGRDARYGKVAILADADPDGRHIAALLLAVCATVAPWLITEGRVHIAVAPLFRVTRSDGEDVWCYSDAERDAAIADLAKAKIGVRGVARYKGLGTMSADELAHTTLDPAHRRMRQLTVGDVTRARATFDLALGPDPAPRREWIVARSDGFNLADLDV
jgi:DNA gyrase subunit B